MFAVLLAALSSVSSGASGFSGSKASQRNDRTGVAAVEIVAVLAQVVGLASLGVVLLIHPPDAWRLEDLAWGAAAGLCVAVAIMCSSRALAIGPVTTASAITALFGTLVPIVAGLAFGERPGVLTIVGVGLSVPAVVLVSAGGPDHGAEARPAPRERWLARERGAVAGRLAFVAGIGFGLFFVLLSRSSDAAGVSPLLAARVVSVPVLALGLTVGRGWKVPRRSSALIVIAGVLACAADVAFLAAVHRGELVWVAAITSLAPVTAVVLARLVTGVRPTKAQVVGLVLAAGAVAAVTAGR
jgi:drug/metabolite transporter (DMT)-like permease